LYWIATSIVIGVVLPWISDFRSPDTKIGG
jgi:hypothetical protein